MIAFPTKITPFLLLSATGLFLSCKWPKPQASISGTGCPKTSEQEITVHFASGAFGSVSQKALVLRPSPQWTRDLETKGFAIQERPSPDFSQAIKGYYSHLKSYGDVRSANANLANHSEVKAFIDQTLIDLFGNDRFPLIRRHHPIARSDAFFDPTAAQSTSIPIIHVDDRGIASRFDLDKNQDYDFYNLWFTVFSESEDIGLAVFPPISATLIRKLKEGKPIEGIRLLEDRDPLDRKVNALQFTTPAPLKGNSPFLARAKVGEVLLFKTDLTPHGAVSARTRTDKRGLARLSVEVRIAVPRP